MELSVQLIRKRLELASSGQAHGISVSALCDGEDFWLGAGGGSREQLYEIGCAAKVLTATLVAVAESQKLLRLEDNVLKYLNIQSLRSDVVAHLRCVRVMHLLNHTHGIDHSRWGRVTYREDGHLEMEAVLGSMTSVDVLARPGTLFIYSNVGAWIVAAILERIYGRCYTAILLSNLLKPLGVYSEICSASGQVCGSTGIGLRMSSDQWIKVLKVHMDDFGSYRELRTACARLRILEPIKIARWPPSGERVTPGWFDYGGSFGHEGYAHHGSSAMRFSTITNMALAVTSSNQRLAKYILTALLSEEDASNDAGARPRLLTRDEVATIDCTAYCGTYENAVCRMRVTKSSIAILCAVLMPRDEEMVGGGRAATNHFIAATGDIFFSVERTPTARSILMFSQKERSGGFQAVRLGAQVLVRKNEEVTS